MPAALAAPAQTAVGSFCRIDPAHRP